MNRPPDDWFELHIQNAKGWTVAALARKSGLSIGCVGGRVRKVRDYLKAEIDDAERAEIEAAGLEINAVGGVMRRRVVSG